MDRWKGFEHGINLGGWLSQCDHTKERYDTFIHEEDIEKIRSFGLDHIRVPVDYDLVEDAEGNYKEEGFGYIQKAIDWSRKYGLNMILDLHKTFGFSFDDGEEEDGFFENEAYQERFFRLWEQFAQRFARYEDTLAFELLNEVTDEAYCAKWNAISGACIRRIRAIAPTVYILVGGYHNNSIEALKDLDPPADDHIIYNFHCYEPVVFTHQGAYWINTMDREFRIGLDATYGSLSDASEEQCPWTASWPASLPRDEVFGADFFEKRFADAVKLAKERGTFLYCGEYGVVNLASPEDTLKWYRAIHSVFEKYGIGRAAWSYKEMDFGLVDPHMDAVREDVLKLL